MENKNPEFYEQRVAYVDESHAYNNALQIAAFKFMDKHMEGYAVSATTSNATQNSTKQVVTVELLGSQWKGDPKTIATTIEKHLRDKCGIEVGLISLPTNDSIDRLRMEIESLNIQADIFEISRRSSIDVNAIVSAANTRNVIILGAAASIATGLTIPKLTYGVNTC